MGREKGKIFLIFGNSLYKLLRRYRAMSTDVEQRSRDDSDAALAKKCKSISFCKVYALKEKYIYIYSLFNWSAGASLALVHELSVFSRKSW